MSFCCFACRFQQRLQRLFVRVNAALHHAAAAAAARAALRAKKLHYRLQIEIRLRLQNEIAALAANKGERPCTPGKQTRRIAQCVCVGIKERHLHVFFRQRRRLQPELLQRSVVLLELLHKSRRFVLFG